MPRTDQLSLRPFSREEGRDALGVDAFLGIERHVMKRISVPLPFSKPIRNAFTLTALLIVIAWFWQLLDALYTLSLEQEHYSHIVLIPLISLYALYQNRASVFGSNEWSPAIGLALIGLGAAGYLVGASGAMTASYLSTAMLSCVVMFWGIFLLSYGINAGLKNAFALLFLLWMVPLPTTVMNEFIVLLQRASAEAADTMFSLIGIPVFRDGFVFSLSNFTIFVSEECSGIRSTLALIITSMMAGHFFLRSACGKIGVVVLMIPLAIVKNAARIVGLALLANYVDPAFITDSLVHRRGGIPLFLLSLIILFGFVLLVRKMERSRGYGSLVGAAEPAKTAGR